MASFAEYLATRQANRQHFAASYPYATAAVDTTLSVFAALAEQLRIGYDHNGKSHVSLAPFYFILQRQAMTAFESLSVNQAYAAWVAVRTGIESALIMGKWVDAKENAHIWERRLTDRTAYRQAYEGKALRSASMSRSPRIQQALSHINDRFLHPNPEYYFRHLSSEELPSGEISLELNFFDNEQAVSVGLLSLLHLISVVQDDIAMMFTSLFVDTPRLDVRLADLEANGAEFRATAGQRSAEAEWLLVNIGLWPAVP
jgi:hypothetical protein